MGNISEDIMKQKKIREKIWWKPCFKETRDVCGWRQADVDSHDPLLCNFTPQLYPSVTVSVMLNSNPSFKNHTLWKCTEK